MNPTVVKNNLSKHAILFDLNGKIDIKIINDISLFNERILTVMVYSVGCKIYLNV